MLYDILLADPPWKYKDNKSNLPKLGGKTYPEMSDEELQGLDIASIMNKDSLLFLWMVWPKMEEGLQLIRAWGFEPVTCGFVWVKLNKGGRGYYSGLGSYVCGNTEFVYIGKRGKGVSRLDKSVKQLLFTETIEAPLQTHSEKPHEVNDRIVRIYGDRPRLEIFARPPVPSGWSATGLDYDGRHIADYIEELKRGNEAG